MMNRRIECFNITVGITYAKLSALDLVAKVISGSLMVALTYNLEVIEAITSTYNF